MVAKHSRFAGETIGNNSNVVFTGLALLEGLRQARTDSRSGFIDGMGRVTGLDLGYTNIRFSKSERGGSRFVDLSLASRNSGLV